MSSSTKPVYITDEFENEADAAYAHMFLRRCGFEEYYNRTEPHLSKEERNERAYRIRNGWNQIEKALEDAGIPASIYE